MATEPKPAARPAFIAIRQIIKGPRKSRVVTNPGQPFVPASDEEAESLYTGGYIVSATDYAKGAGGEVVTAALAAANARADAAEAALAKLSAGAAPAKT